MKACDGPNSCAFMPVSAMMVGDSTAIACRSTKASHEHSAMPMHGTHICQAARVIGDASIAPIVYGRRAA
jgi:hypothetical protein